MTKRTSMAERNRRDGQVPARQVDKRDYTGTVPTSRIPVPSYTGPAAGAKRNNSQSNKRSR